jgi:hypothetical protein
MTNTDAGADQGQGGTTSPKEMAAKAAQTVKQEAQSFAASAQDKAKDRVEQTKETATRTLGDFANAVRKAGDELSQSDQSVASRMVQKAADGLEGLSRSVADKRPEELLDSVREFGRRNPTAFIAGAVLIGLAVGRFIKSSSDGGSQGFSGQDGYGSGSGGLYSGEAPLGLGEDVGAGGVNTLAADVGDDGGGFASSVGGIGSGLEDSTDEIANEGALDGDDRDRARFTPEV